MIKILAIGNSFSQDAAYYLHDIAKTVNTDIKVVNLYIGGCSLERHWNNIAADAADYDYELNGQSTGRKISIKEALQEESWDYITLQQVSGDSGRLDTYEPYITEIYDYVRQQVPDAEVLLHQTWAYEVDSEHPDFAKYDRDQKKMSQMIEAAYRNLSDRMALRVIPGGKVIEELRAYPTFDYAKGGMSLCRDGFHMNLVYGRYALGATWFETILKKNILDNDFLPQRYEGPNYEGTHTVIEFQADEVDPAAILLVKKTVHRVCNE